ncbi:uncharacterized protein BXIN_1810 [Babesia sp. Xinjiang]|uniref:uncharacterized protein n=1 Tax=Babesia sp. Xinjiang TaxID=462227 RepID=UPI000A21CF68|nr:uncharacterized protein BXIN_1609 [Babesia sp. Xinjiang]XP_028871491.1 uncharacterized protein BXIN_1810 [Babesia sp. Xinjiang]ORM41028.1 hypothetical protein BXIN_1609 [Babesia sp. Xinjiang]ORM41035.1 hypothetical protein BXIN_1810 [Babesia sp. Xinjiang]
MIFICALVVIKIDNIPGESDEVDIPVYFLVAYAFCLVVPFAYYAYRLGLHEYTISLFQRLIKRDTSNNIPNANNMVGDGAEVPEVESRTFD